MGSAIVLIKVNLEMCIWNISWNIYSIENLHPGNLETILGLNEGST